MHYDSDVILEHSVNKGGVRHALIALDEGDTAYAPGTTKYWLKAGGPATVDYAIYNDGGWEAHTEGKVWRSLRDERIS